MKAKPLTEMMRKYLVRMDHFGCMREADPGFPAAKATIRALERKGLAARVQDETGEWVWEPTAPGRAALTHAGEVES